MMKLIKCSFLLLCLSFIAVSCGDDEEDCDNLATVMVGTWESANLGTGDFTFQADGSFVDNTNLLLPDSITNKTWATTGNASVAFSGTTPSGATTTAALDVESFDCDNIVLEQSGNLFNLSKK